jgi:thymidylate synthase (FAD)
MRCRGAISISDGITQISVVLEPNVYCLARPQFINSEVKGFLADEGYSDWDTDTDIDAEVLVELAGRSCYQSFKIKRNGGNKEYIGHILEVGHGSVLEHAVFSVMFTGVSRSFTHELIRHRAGFGYSQLSQRYVDESEGVFVVPPAIHPEFKEYLARSSAERDMDDLYSQYMVKEWLDSIFLAQRNYKSLSDSLCRKYSDIEDRTLRRKKAREAARSVLPNATETKILATANARSWRHFWEMRASESADQEMCRAALASWRLLSPMAPNLFGDYRVMIGVDGREYLETDHRKV